MASGSLNRRTFIQLTGAAMLLQACTPAAPPAPTAARPAAGAATSSAVKLPTYVPFSGPKPDFEGSPDGVIPAAYLNYPRNPVRSVSQPVGKGEDVSALMYTTQAPPTPADQNKAWQQVNKELGVSMKFPIIQLADFNAKLNTTISGGQLPDLLSLGTGNGSAILNLPAFLESQCSDLTQFVSGDAIKEFPNLANLPPFAWRNAVFNNKILAVPVVRTSISAAIMFGKGRVLDTVGGVSFGNKDDFLARMKQLTGGGTQWGLGATSGAANNGIPSMAIYFLESFGAPNIWREAGGKLTKDWETEEFKAAIGYVRSLWEAGVMHPDTPTATVNQAAQNFYAGKTVLWQNGFTIGDVAWNRALAMDPNFGMRGVAPFSADGKLKPVHHLGAGAALLTVVKKTTPDKVKEMLGILNYLSAPFGTAEFLLIWYGIQGTEFELDANGNPQVTEKGQPDLFIPWPNLGSPASVLYNARSPEYARVMHADGSAIQSLGIQNPTVGLYSRTNADRATALNQKMGDGLLDIIFGRSDMNTFDQLVKDWRSSGGDQIRTEFEQALQAGR